MSSSTSTTVEAPLDKLRRLHQLQAAVALRAAAKSKAKRAGLLEQCPHPLALAMHLDPSIVSTPAMELLSREWVAALRAHDGRLVLSTPGQQGKTTLSRFAVFWALLKDPSRRVMYASYGVTLARESGREVRTLIESYGGPYGLVLDRSHRDATDWSLEKVPGAAHAGGMVSISPDSRATGLPADVMVIDDIYSGEAEAHSPATLRKVETWWESTARIRMAPGTSVITIGTRFGEKDLLGRFIDDGWRRINIPALADGHAVDSLEGIPEARSPGGWLVSTRGTTEADWRTIRAESSERVFTSVMQGSPTAPSGNLFRADWFEKSRVRREKLPRLRTIVIAVDPAETGTGDEAGILVGGAAGDGHLYLLADLSGQLSQGEWARVICLGFLRYGANRVLAERTLGMNTAVRDAWAILRRQATALESHDGAPGRAAATLTMAGDEAAADLEQLEEVVDWVDGILSLPRTGPRVKVVTSRQSKQVRAEAVTSLFELGRAHIVGRLPLLEAEAQQWIPGVGKSPNRVDVLAHLLTHLDRVVPASRTGKAPVQDPPEGVPAASGDAVAERRARRRSRPVGGGMASVPSMAGASARR